MTIATLKKTSSLSKLHALLAETQRRIKYGAPFNAKERAQMDELLRAIEHKSESRSY